MSNFKNDCPHHSCECLAEILRNVCQERDLYKKALEKYAMKKNHRDATEALIEGREIWGDELIPDFDDEGAQ